LRYKKGYLYYLSFEGIKDDFFVKYSLGWAHTPLGTGFPPWILVGINFPLIRPLNFLFFQFQGFQILATPNKATKVKAYQRLKPFFFGKEGFLRLITKIRLPRKEITLFGPLMGFPFLPIGLVVPLLGYY